MKIQNLLIGFLGLAMIFSQAVKADTMLDGYWELDVDASVTCVGKATITKPEADTYLKKYGKLSLHLSDLQAVKYLITEEGESIASQPFPMTEIKSNKVYVIKHPGTTISDVTLILLNDQNQTRLEYRTYDFEWNLCQGSQHRLIFNYVSLNP